MKSQFRLVNAFAAAALVYNNWFAADFSGYFIHDMIDVIAHGPPSNVREVVPHHIAVLKNC